MKCKLNVQKSVTFVALKNNERRGKESNPMYSCVEKKWMPVNWNKQRGEVPVLSKLKDTEERKWKEHKKWKGKSFLYKGNIKLL